MTRRPPTIKQSRYTVRHGCHDCWHGMITWPDGGEPKIVCKLSGRTVHAAGWCGAKHETRKPLKKEASK